MNNEFKKITQDNVTRYVLENASSGGTSSGSVATVPGALGKVRKRGDNILAQEADKKTVPASTPRNFVAKNAKTGGAGQHKDKKKAEKQGDVKHRKPFAEQGVAEGSLGTALLWPEVVNKVSGAMKAMGWKGTRKADGTFMFSTRGQETDDQYYTVIIDNAGEGFFTYALGTIEEGDPRIGEQESLPNTEASVSELMNAIRDGFGLSEQDVAEGFNGEYDDEAGMAQSNLITTARAVMGLLKTIKDRDNLPEWGQEKIAKAEMMLVSVWDYLQSQKAMGNDPQQGVAEAIVSSGDATLELLELNIFKDLIGEHSLSNYDEEFAQSPNWQKVVARWTPKAEGLYDLVIRLHNAGKKISSQEARAITDTAYDGSDAYNDPESAASDLPRIYAQQYNAISQFIQNISNPKPNNMHEQGVAEGDAYIESLQTMMERQLEPTMDLDAWVDNFQNADPQKYHQFKNKTPEKKK